jgi:hypothetical protein
MAGDVFTIKFVSDDFEEGMSAGVKGGGTAAVSGLGAQLAAGFEIFSQIKDVIGDTVNSLLKPIKSMLGGIARMLGELLRPIVEVVMIVIRPVFMLLKPLIQLFKTFMAPFMELGRQFGQIAQQQMAAGDVSGAMSTSLEAVATILGPFVVSLTSVALQLATTMFISGVTSLMNGILEVVKSAFMVLPEWIGGAAVDGITAAQEALNSGSQVLIDTINGKITQATQAILAEMQATATQRLAELKGTFPGELDDALVQPPLGAMDELKTGITESTTDLKDSVATTLDTMGTKVSEKMGANGKVVIEFQSGLDTMVSAARTFKAKLEAISDDINGIDIKKKKSSRGNINFLGIQVNT